MTELEALREVAKAAEDFREQVIRNMYAEGFPKEESRRLLDALVLMLRIQKGRPV